MKNGSKKFLVFDGNSLTHRAFYALPLLTTSSGVITNAAFGFTNMFLKAMEEVKPDYVAVAFDRSRVTFRHEMFAEYKGTRPGTPDELRPQFPLIKEILAAMRVPVLEKEGYEADDIIATLVRMAEEKGWETVVVTGDRDAFQLISPRTRVMITRKGISELEVYDEAKLKERYGLPPHLMPDLKGLMGDPSDNVPGVPGIGEKTAVKLLQEYGSLDEVLRRRDEIKGKVGDALRQYGDQARLSRELVTVERDVPLEVDIEKDCLVQEPDYDALLRIFRKLEFRTLARAFLEKQKAREKQQDLFGEGLFSSPPAEAEVKVATLDYEALADVVREEKIAVAYRYRGSLPREEMEKAAVRTTEGRTYYSEGDGEVLRRLWQEAKGEIILHDAKKAFQLLGGRQGKFFDTMIAAYLLNPGQPNQKVGELALKYLGRGHLEEDSRESLVAEAEIVANLREMFSHQLKELEMEYLFYEVELPLAAILAEMELTGIKVDVEKLQALGEEYQHRLEQISQEIYDICGEEFNLNSPRQLGYILFEKMKLPPVKKTKTGYSTDVEVLETLASEHEVVAKILDYRQLMKLKSTYVDGLLKLVNPVTGRVHTTFNQTVTTTGRLSSTEPNLQNIPIRMEEGRRIREAFVTGEEGWLLLSADYSQIELRVLAHLAGDEKLIEAFCRGEDIHTRTAVEVFGVSPAEVTPEMRRRAKAVNFGIIYGISDFGLARDLKIDRKEAKQYIENYFRRYPGVKRYLDATVAAAREKGYVTTILNRRRYLPDLFSPNRNLRSFGERTAMNTPIQGSAADIIKLAMIAVRKALREKGMRARLLLQVHDELLFEVPAEELQPVAHLVREAMERVLPLRVPLEVELKQGKNWYSMEKLEL
ncbi:MAG: polymerase [Eubacteriales bacterium]|nr:polymerase [Eubacteriales bacterium]MDN5363141.1 polymerase [Eubacteriales bacterium]